MGPTWGLSGADRTQAGPKLAPWTLLSGTWMVKDRHLSEKGIGLIIAEMTHHSTRDTAYNFGLSNLQFNYLELSQRQVVSAIDNDFQYKRYVVTTVSSTGHKHKQHWIYAPWGVVQCQEIAYYCYLIWALRHLQSPNHLKHGCVFKGLLMLAPQI